MYVLLREREAMMNREEIERRFAGAGWKIDDGFADHLVVGNDTVVSIMASREVWGTDNPVFELWDEERDVVLRLGEIPTPRRAQELLRESGKPFGEE